jgi:serpin B
MISMRPVAAAAFALALAAACVPSTEEAPLPVEHVAPPADTPWAGSSARSSLARLTTTTVPASDRAAVVAGNNTFALELHRQIREPGKNSMTSPFSISTALAMTYAGARGTTEAQMAQALHFTVPQARLHAAFNEVDLAMRQPQCTGTCPDVREFKLRTANSAWAQTGYPFEAAYLDTLAQSYGSGVNLVDFVNAAEPARLAINGWVATATEDKVKNLLSPGQVDSLTRLVLTNAVYFKGTWESQFAAASTAPASFHLLDGSAVSVDTMHQSATMRGASGPAYDAVELRYRDSQFSMVLVSPAAGKFESFEGSLDLAGVTALDQALVERQVTLSMPKFTFEWKSSLGPALQSLGMTQAFVSGQADFTGMSSTNELYVGDVIHQTFVAVDEQGTEAAAATAVVMAGGGLPPPAMTVSLDRPFLFFIRHRPTGQILFLGRVVDPR